MSVTIGVRTLVSFAAGLAVAVIALLVFQAVQADAAPGDDDSTLVTITACRLFDTRITDRVGPYEAFGPKETKTIAARGKHGECSIPSDAVALSLNVTAVGASASTFLTIWPDGPLPKASSLNPGPGQPPVPNAVVTKLAGDGSFRVYNLAGSVNVIADVNGYYTQSSLQSLDERLATLEAINAAQQDEIDALEALTTSMSVVKENGHPTVRFTGVNVQITSGSGATTGQTNGRGNLFIGYNEDTSVSGEVRGGSHNIVVGAEHDYNGYGALITGHNHEVEDRAVHAAVLGGANSYVTGAYSAAVAGEGSSVQGHFSAVVGGFGNSTQFDSDYAVALGGLGNSATGQYSSISGGWGNSTSGQYSSVSGGQSNSAGGEYSSVSGGKSNAASADHSSVLGGRMNQVQGANSAVAGGVSNNASGADDVIAGGDNITCPYADAVICGEYTTFTDGWDAQD